MLFATFSVIAPVIVSEASDVVNAAPGSDVIFLVLAKGENLLYAWEYGNGSSLSTSDSRFAGINSNRLTISNSKFSDGGLYACVVSNGAGTARSTAALTIGEYKYLYTCL